MLRLVQPDEHPAAPAYAIPWQIERIDGLHSRITNGSTSAAGAVRIFTATRTTHLGSILPGATVDLCLCGEDADTVVTTIAWYRPDDEREYIWRFVL